MKRKQGSVQHVMCTKPGLKSNERSHAFIDVTYSIATESRRSRTWLNPRRKFGNLIIIIITHVYSFQNHMRSSFYFQFSSYRFNIYIIHIHV